MRVRKVGCAAKVRRMGRDDELLEAFAAELRNRRHDAELSQEKLAYDAGVNRTYIAKLELAKNQPTLRILNSLATALNITLPVLIQAVWLRYEQNCVKKKTILK
jgi:transcriptional regulator with XRE-family HTH domain